MAFSPESSPQKKPSTLEEVAAAMREKTRHLGHSDPEVIEEAEPELPLEFGTPPNPKDVREVLRRIDAPNLEESEE